MEILKKSHHISTIGILLIIVALLLLIVFVIMLIGSIYDSESRGVINIASLVLLFIGILTSIYGVVKTSDKYYSIYLTNMTLQEFETEYEPISIDGLIITARKKGE